MKSYNSLVVVKCIKGKEFGEFIKFFKEYYQHVMTRKSSLSKIYGMYEVRNQHCYIVMQNLLFNVNTKTCMVYDLKGADMKRFALFKEEKMFTGRDTNLKLDRNAEPFCLPSQDYDESLTMLERDCNFLVEKQVIDYSLLLVVDPLKRTLRIGIIDFMRPFTIFERFENIYKKILHSGADPTVIQPKSYKDRFFTSIEKFLLRTDTL